MSACNLLLLLGTQYLVFFILLFLSYKSLAETQYYRFSSIDSGEAISGQISFSSSLFFSLVSPALNFTQVNLTIEQGLIETAHPVQCSGFLYAPRPSKSKRYPEDKKYSDFAMNDKDKCYDQTGAIVEKINIVFEFPTPLDQEGGLWGREQPSPEDHLMEGLSPILLLVNIYHDKSNTLLDRRSIRFEKYDFGIL